MHTASQPMKMLARLAVLLALLAAVSCRHADSAAVGRVQLTHAGAGSGLTGREALHRMVVRSKARAKHLLRRGASAPVSPGPLPAHDNPQAEYLAHLSIGTPPQPVQLTLDTGSDLTWTQCQPCGACFDQALPHWDPARSSTFAYLPCGSSPCRHLQLSTCGARSWGNGTCVYTYFYGDRSLTNGLLAVDAFSFAAGNAVPGLPFGCGIFNSGVFKNNETGIAGFGRGALSLPTQLNLVNFSHCFTPITATPSRPSSLLLHLPANLYRGGARVQTTPLVKNPVSPSFYYLSLKGITVGDTRLPVPESAFALMSNGSGGAIIDSGTALTSFPPEVYRLLHDAFASQTKLPVAADGGVLSEAGSLCFTVPPGARPEVPKLVLHLEGATLDLPRESYMFEIQEAHHSTICLAVVEGEEKTIIGNFQQQNLHVLYDLANNKLSFVPAQCDKL